VRRPSWLFPLLFVTLFGSGYPIAKLGYSAASPLAFLSIRLVIATILLAGIALALRANWPRGVAAAHTVAAGLQTVGLFAIAGWVAVAVGVSPGLCTLVIALQPLLMAVTAPMLLGERVSRTTVLGLVIAFVGVALVVAHTLASRSAPPFGIALAVLSLIGLSAGTLYQKRFCAQMDPFAGGAIQSGVSAIAAFAVGVLSEPMHVEWNGTFVFALAFMSVAVSVGAISMLYVMLREGTATRVASTFYLLPVVAEIVSFALFHTPITAAALGGIAIVAVGVGVANLSPKRGKQLFDRRSADEEFARLHADQPFGHHVVKERKQKVVVSASVE
jgi:drug/metabolite transporter (DMT)-like permease